jgi:DNA invertase Pin-like site-specific DNA recombinase
MNGGAIPMSPTRLVPAVQYLRMSTDDQPNSIATQRDGIQVYATAHGFRIVATYADPGKSGLDIRSRPGLRSLLGDVVSGKCSFQAILVYDVSRWGRFQDTDESAHYEFLCRRAGVPVHYCAEEFDNDEKPPNAIMKTLKRTMAAEYSRELSLKITAAHRRMAEQGYHVGGRAGYGLRRMLIKANGREEILETGEYKNLMSDRVVLVPGPRNEVECVRKIFKLAAKEEYSPRAIAEELNRQKIYYCDNTPWDYLRVYRVLNNPRYIGNALWGIRDTRFHNKAQRRPQGEWVINSRAIPAIITVKEFTDAQKRAQDRFTRRACTKRDLLNRIAKTLRERPLSKEVMRRRHLLRGTWIRRFGPISQAYELIGYKSTRHIANSMTAHSKINSLRKKLFDDLKELFPSRTRMVCYHGHQRFRVLELDNRIRVAVYICRNRKPSVSGEPRWTVGIRHKYRHLPALFCLPDKELSRLTAFYFVKDVSATKGVYTDISPRHPWLAEENRFESLSDFCRFTTLAMEGHPPVPIRLLAFSAVGDVLFSDDNSTFIIDGNEIPLSTPNAAVFRLLLRNAGRVVARSTLSHAGTNRDKDLYLNIQIGELRRALGSEYRQRIVTVRNEGYVYHRAPTSLPT